ncbi:hypothetical protein SKAU_G00204760 [Synaphobranchus kaupii]|uniref:Uncharacterized protein n=1 Tax=Synaphobranchus kaupii TaxID=118154 RepID=A0A9Q1IWF3_SYNKA|nr:hypothetical protein SKAU_G00204760 [Synaphobranchus kaupii]
MPEQGIPPPPYSSGLMTDLLRSEVDGGCFGVSDGSAVQGRFLFSPAGFPGQDFVENIKVEPSLDGYGPAVGTVPLSGPKIKQEGNVSCMMSFEQPRPASSPHAAGSMTPPLSPEDPISSECQSHMRGSLALSQGYHTPACFPPHAAALPHGAVPSVRGPPGSRARPAERRAHPALLASPPDRLQTQEGAAHLATQTHGDSQLHLRWLRKNLHQELTPESTPSNPYR